MPRWRRPSLRAARMASERAPAPAAVPLAFGDRAADGAERARIRYQLVRLTDEPDEIRSTQIAQLVAGDEVEVLERRAAWARVRTPMGVEGWVPKMTLGAVDEGATPSSTAGGSTGVGGSQAIDEPEWARAARAARSAADRAAADRAAVDRAAGPVATSPSSGRRTGRAATGRATGREPDRRSA